MGGGVTHDGAGYGDMAGTVLSGMGSGKFSVQLSEREPTSVHRIYLFGAAARKYSTTKKMIILMVG